MLIYRQTNRFIINKAELKPKANTTEIRNALYAAIYDEFSGAVKNPKYRNLTSIEKMNKLNEFANNWLQKRGLA